MTPSEETASLRRGIRLDLIIAVCALLISSLATAASFWQSRVVAEQLSSQVWPYLSFQTTYDPKFVSLEIANDGLGPAIIRSMVLTVDGRIYPDPSQAFRRVFRPEKGAVSAQLRGVSPGSVIRAGAAAQLFRINAKWAARQYGAAAGRIDFRVCYCSVLGNCWMISAREQTQDPHPMSSCPDPGAAQYRVSPGRIL
ncbi:MAG TPA: hypothetical protein VGD01_00785 [Candidatus Elarobacter sp.]|jgi:hypothetical protein